MTYARPLSVLQEDILSFCADELRSGRPVSSVETAWALDLNPPSFAAKLRALEIRGLLQLERRRAEGGKGSGLFVVGVRTEDSGQVSAPLGVKRRCLTCDREFLAPTRFIRLCERHRDGETT